MGFFGAAHGWAGGGEAGPLPKICQNKLQRTGLEPC